MSDAHAEVEAMRREVERLRATVDATERRLRATHAVARVLADNTSIEAAIPEILGALGHALGAALAGYWVPNGDVLEVRATWRADGVSIDWDAASRAEHFAEGIGLPGRVWHDRAPVWIAEVAHDPKLPRSDALRDASIRSAIAFPIVAGSDLLGVIELFMRDGQPADEILAEVLRAIGGHLGQFVRSARVALELDAERETLAKLNDIGMRLSGELDPQTLVQAVVDVCSQLTGAQIGAFFYTTYGDHETMSYCVSGIGRETFARFQLPRHTPVLAPAFTGKGPVRIDDVTKDPRYGRNPPHKGVPAAHPAIRSYLAVPVMTRSNRVLGAMFFGHDQPGVFTDRAMRLAVGLANHAATAMDNARLFADQQRLIKELEKTNGELDQFAYAASHDLRAPLRGITNLAAWIEEDLGDATPATVRDHVGLLKGRAARMDSLISGLLELARVGRTRQRPERVDVTELVHESIDLLSPGEDARVMIVGALPMMVAERFAMQQVFLNLIANALQHAGRTDVEIRISALERPDDVEFSVADNGVGIPVEHHERVWQIFQTLSSRDIVESTGIGLAIVKKQVDGAGGTAWIDAQAHPGTTVRFTWPLRTK